MPDKTARRFLAKLVSVAWLITVVGCNYPGLRAPVSSLTVEDLRATLAAQAVRTPEASLGPSITQPAPASTDPGMGALSPTSAIPGMGALTPAPLATQAGSPNTYIYITQSGDTLPALALRFQVQPQEIHAAQALPARGLIAPGQELLIPKKLETSPPFGPFFPDSEVIHSPGSAGFDIDKAIDQAGGYLSHYSETVKGERLSGASIIERVAVESSINPRLLLALVELRSGWVRGLPGARVGENYPIGFHVGGWEGLYKELVIAATHLNAGYYGWRAGNLTQVEFRNGQDLQISPGLNAGSAAILNLLSKLYDADDWLEAALGPAGLVQLSEQMFGGPWRLATEPLFPAALAQPELSLPFPPGERWSLTGGPHPSWKTGSPRGAIDLAPVTGEARCAVSRAWVIAPAAGLVVRSERNVVALDLDGDGFEQTGWVIIFLHIADAGRVPAGTSVKLDQQLGHPSCEGGTSTGTHVHLALKYNGEWLAVDGPLPIVLGGWEAFAGEKNYQGGMRNGSQEVVASPVGPRTSILVR